MRVIVAKQAPLQHAVWRGLNSGHHVRGRKRRLLHLRKVVGRVAVQDHAPELAQRVLLVRPHLGQVEGVPVEPLGVLQGHRLRGRIGKDLRQTET